MEIIPCSCSKNRKILAQRLDPDIKSSKAKKSANKRLTYTAVGSAKYGQLIAK